MCGEGNALSSRGRKLQRSQWRMLLEWLNQQLPTVAPITLSTAPGRGGEAARPVRKAHREKPEKLPKNKLACFIGIFLAFLMPGSSLDVIQVTGGNKFGFFRLLHRPLRSRRRILLAQRFGGRGGLQRFPFASFCFLCSILIRYQYEMKYATKKNRWIVLVRSSDFLMGQWRSRVQERWGDPGRKRVSLLST